ncbi:hypothetical protein CLOM_g21615 [Closterium sp. NIES-68]|nr:hypothetical protein CLOM_g21615 [Closterium sp. NIES-68]GJP72939.1 hypothetical protein CLOP_g3707 [Closterium sp. NIES-67]
MTCRRECAVCLGEYVAGERIKVVPACAHGFHADCIDLWLAAKTTCPICRTDIEPKSPTETIPPNPPIPPQEGLRSEPGGRSSETAAGESAVRGTVGTDGGVAETGAAERQEAALLFAAVAATAGEGEGGDTGDGAALVAAGRRGAVGRPLEWRGKANWQEHEVWSEYDDGGRTEERACCSRGRSTLNKAVIAKEFVGIEAPEECVLFERCIEAGTKCMGWRGEKHIMLGS